MNIAYCLNIFYFKTLGLKRVKRYVLIMISGNIVKQTFEIYNFSMVSFLRKEKYLSKYFKDGIQGFP